MEKNKLELIEEAEGLGIDVEDMTKQELKDAIEAINSEPETELETEPEPELDAPIKKKKKKKGSKYPVHHPHGVLQIGKSGLSTGG